MNLRALLELMRVSNLPTVWSNCWLGWVAGIYVAINTHASDQAVANLQSDLVEVFGQILLQASLIAAAISLLYVGGMVLNDFLDREVDAIERPTRPIPSGRISAKQALILSVFFLVTGMVGVSLVEYRYHPVDAYPWRATAFAAVLIVAIIVYNTNHTRTASSVFVMGACRGLVILTCASVRTPPMIDAVWLIFVAGPAIGLVIYTLAISIVARREVAPDGPRKFGGPKTVMNMIAAMPLLDALWLVVMGLWPASLFCVGCAVLTKLGHRKVAGS